MHLSIKKIFGVSLLVVAVLLSVISSEKASRVSAQSPSPSPECRAIGTQVPFYGWVWSSTIGWISFNSLNPGSGGNHCVRLNTADNTITGWAWSSNIGWIKFGGLSDFPASGSAVGNAVFSTSDNQIKGWARACAGTTTGDCSTMNSRTDGWDGWIELTGTNHTISYVNNAMTGFAWGSDVVGLLEFNVRSDAPVAAAASCTLTNSLVTAKTGTSPAVYNLEWSSIGSYPCAGVNFTAGSESGNTNVAPTVSTAYSLSCPSRTSGGSPAMCSTSITVPTDDGGGGGGGGTDPTCPPNCGSQPAGVSMWLNNDAARAQRIMKIKPGQAAKINWIINTTEEPTTCAAYFGEDFETIDTVNKDNLDPYLKTGLGIGQHIVQIECVVANKTIKAFNYNHALGTQHETMIINVVDPVLEEI